MCGGKLNVQKTRKKTIITLDIGAFRVRETVLECPQDKSIYTCQELRDLVPYRCTFGFDVLVYVGKALFIHCRSDQEIIKKLAERNIPISDRQIAYLGKKFIIYLALAHRESQKQLKKAMDLRGGYILHMDGTCEGDSPHLFTGLDEVAEIVLDNIKLPSEKADLLIPFFRQIKRQYGDPLALVHDMGKGIMAAIEEVFPNIPDFICHFHFLRDIGKDLFGEEYLKVKNLLTKYKIRTILRQKAKALEKFTCETEVIRDLQASINKGNIEPSLLQKIPAVSTYVLIHWAFEISDQLQGYGFPFDRPHLIFYQRLKVLHASLKNIMDTQPQGKMTHKRLIRGVWQLLNDLINNKELNKYVERLEEKTKVFDKLRKALRIALPEGKKGLNDDGEQINIKTIEEKVKEFRKWITTEEYFSKNKDYQKMVKQIDKYWEKLFADPLSVTTPNGQLLLQPQRTNNIMERFFRDLKRRSRKKSGTACLNKTLKAILADTPLIRNLENEDYLKIILNGCASLEERFSKIDSKLVFEELKQAQKNLERIPPEVKKIIKQPNLPQKITSLLKA
jgi:hypothetical protein